MRKKPIRFAALIIPLLAILLINTAVRANDLAVAVDDVYETFVDDNLSVDAPGVLENDEDANNDPLTAILVDDSQAAGLLFLYEDGSFEYEPAPGFFGTDTFTYVANDGSGNSNEATITFHVTLGTGMTVFRDQKLFLAALSTLGYRTYREGFENDTVWGDIRTTITGGQISAPSVTNLGLTWTANNQWGGVTTSSGAARRGEWGFYTLPHGSFLTGTDCHLPINCGDGWQGHSSMPMVAVGGWVRTNTPYAGLHVYLDSDMSAPIDFNGAVLGGSHQFFGVIAPNGFTQFEFREIEGTNEDAKFIFTDDYIFAYESNLSIKVSRLKVKLNAKGTKVVAKALVVDQDKTAAAGALIEAQWRVPDGTIKAVSGTTNGLGKIKWVTPYVAPGDYTLAVLNVSLPDHVYTGGKTVKTLTLP